MKLDYTIQSPEERKQLVEQIIAETPDISPKYLEILADYLVISAEKQERKEKMILTENRMVTVNKRECSLDGLASQLDNGEDGLYNIIRQNDKNVLFQPKISITQEDLDTIPLLRQVREAIDMWEGQLKKATGKDRYIIKKTLIDLRKDQYLIKQAYQKPVVPCRITKSPEFHVPLEDQSYMDENNEVVVKGVSLMNHKVVSAILCNYSKLKEDSYDQFEGDMWYLILDFENTCDKALEDYPIYQRIVELKIDGKQNSEIHDMLYEEFGETYTPEYISALWKNKIPKLIATQALEDFITWHFKNNNLYMKKCSKCGQLKPGHHQFFSRNNTSKDFWYSICKDCRSVRKKKT